jgi:hypothetical protein
MAVTPMPPDTDSHEDPPFGHIPYGVDKLNVIRAAIAGYAGGAAIVRELVQNADDAGSAWLTFRILPAELIVQNGSLFSEDNFRAICTIAAGNKREDAYSIGTWGTGFLSVYQLTDHPELHSNGMHLVFDPRKNELAWRGSAVLDQTEFHFPWRTRRTEIGDHLELTTPWTPDRIAELRDALPDEIGRVLLFLRNVRRITLYEGDSDMSLFEARLEQQGADEEVAGGIRQRWTLSVQDRRKTRPTTSIQPWVVYRTSLDDGFRRDGAPIKSPDVALAYRLKPPSSGEEGALVPDGSLDGVLYNYLPTRLTTGFAFHINGDFFPTNNRDAILDDDSERAAWNRHVVTRIAQLFADNLARIRDDSGLPTAFYDVLPLTPAHAILDPFPEHLRATAVTVPIVQSTRMRWTIARDLRLTRNDPTLWRIAKDHLEGVEPRSASGDRQLSPALTRLLSGLGARDLLPSDVVTFVKAHVSDGVPFAQAHPILGSREQLDALLRYVARLQSARSQAGPLRDGADVIEGILDGAPVFLDAVGRLRAWGLPHLALADQAARRALSPELLSPDVHVADAEFEHQHGLLLDGRVHRLGPREIIAHLARVAGRCVGRTVDETHPFVNSWERLRAVFDYLADNRAVISDTELRPLALCVDEDGVLQRARPDSFDGPLLADESTRALLEGAPDLRFVHPDLRGDARYAEVLQRMGVPTLTPARLAELLSRYFDRRRYRYLSQLQTFLRSAERVCAFYRYFHTHAGTLDGDTVDRLRKLPFVLTQQQSLGAIDDPNVPVMLPPVTGTGEPFEDVMHRLELVADVALEDGLRSFFARTLRAQGLSRITYIDQCVVPHYGSRSLTHEARLTLLGLVRDAYGRIRQEQPALLDRLRKTALIRCQDDRYRPASEVYLPSDLLDGVFPHGYHTPHQSYGITRPEPSDARRGSRRAESLWPSLFFDLGLRDTPAAEDLVRSVRDTVVSRSPRPTDAAIRHVQRVYGLLNERWESEYLEAEATLRDLRTMKWLPAENRDGRWHQPAEVYPSTVRALVGDQEPVLPFRQAGGGVSDFLGLPREPRPASVVKHLRAAAAASQAISAGDVYQFLGRHCEHPDVKQALPALREAAVIYDKDRARYWRPAEVLLGNFWSEFGKYRFYADPGEARQFFADLGVRDRYEVRDFALLLLGIADAARDPAATVDDEDRRLMNQAWGRLADTLGEAPEAQPPVWLSSLQVSPVVIDHDHRLVCPADAVLNDRPDLLERFPTGAIRVAVFAGQRTPVLLAALGVRSLSEMVKRRLVRRPTAVQPDIGLTFLLSRLGEVFARVMEHQRTEHPDGWAAIEDLDRIQVFSVDSINIQHVVDLPSGEVTAEPEQTPAFLDRTGGRRGCSSTGKAATMCSSPWLASWRTSSTRRCGHRR